MSNVLEFLMLTNLSYHLLALNQVQNENVTNHNKQRINKMKIL